MEVGLHRHSRLPQKNTLKSGKADKKTYLAALIEKNAKHFHVGTIRST